MTEGAFNKELRKLRKFFKAHVDREVRKRVYASSRGQSKRVKHRRELKRQMRLAMKAGAA